MPEIKATDQRIQDLLCCALEGGSNYWIAGYRKEYPIGKARGDYEFPHLELPLAEGGSLIISPGEGEEPRTLDRVACFRGLQIMAEKYPKHFADFLAENEDADTGDIFLQCALFGEVIFG